jgi:hypothetical protein
MRSRSCALTLLAIVGTAGGAFGMEEEFSEFRLGLGITSGFDHEKDTHSTLSGAPDPGSDRSHELTGKIGFDAQPAIWMGSVIDDGWSIVSGAGISLRTPGGTYATVTDTGTANGAGTGDVLLNYRERVNAVMFGFRFSGGLAWTGGPLRIEVTPFAGVGATRAHFQESMVYTNDPNNLLTPNDSNASYTNNGAYFEYGLATSAFLELSSALRVGGTLGWQGSRSVVHVDQHGPFMDGSDRVLLMRSGYFIDAVGVISF